MAEMIVLGLCLFARHVISDSFLFERGTFLVIVMGKLPSPTLVRIICAIGIIWAIWIRIVVCAILF
jgi:hypothetical protein